MTYPKWINKEERKEKREELRRALAADDAVKVGSSETETA